MTSHSQQNHAHAKITDLIEQENDPKDRAFLIVLQQINISLIANTSTINDVADKLDKHLSAYENHSKKEQELYNTGRGMWKVAAWIIGIMQAIVIAVIPMVWNGHGQLLKSINDVEHRVTVIEAAVKK